MMKKYLFLIAILPLMAIGQTTPFSITGKVSDTNNSLNTLVYLSFKQNGKTVIDSSKLDNGSYFFKGNLAYPTIATISLKVSDSTEKYHQQTRFLKNYAFDFYIDKGSITANAPEKMNSTVIKGSAAEDDNQLLKMLIKPYQQKSNDLYTQEGIKTYASKDQLSIAKYTKKRDLILKQIDSVKKAYLFSHPQSGIALKMLSEYTRTILEPTEIDPIFKQIQPRLKSSLEGVAYAKRLENARSTRLGILAPDFTLKDRNGKEISLSSLKGKIVLLDFWGSWCYPCRSTHPHLKELYETYKDKNFEILGVSNENGSPEQNYKKWTAALDEDKMTWLNVLAEKGTPSKPSVVNQYNVNAFPTKIIINKEGVIIKKFVGSGQLNSEELDKLIKELTSK